MIRLRNSIFGILLGIFFIVGGILLGNWIGSNKKYCTAETSGIICRYDQYSDDEGTIMYTPIVEYYVENEQYYCSLTSTNKKPYTVGESIDVLYNPEDPSMAYKKGDKTDVIVKWACVGVGSLTIIGSFTNMFRPRRIV